MPSLKTIWVWGSPDDKSEDLTAFEDVSRSACEIVSEGARELGLSASRSELRIFTFNESPDRPATELVADLGSAPRVAHVAVPVGFASLSVAAQQELALSRFSSLLKSLVEDSGWGDDVPTGLIDRVRQAGFVFRWQSPPKASPDRLHRALLRARLDPSGLGHVAIVVLTKGGEVVAESSEVRVRPTVEEFARTAKSLLWTDVSHVRCLRVGSLEVALP